GRTIVFKPALERSNPTPAYPPDIEAMHGEYSRWAQEWKPDLIYANSVASLPIIRTLSLPSAPVLLHVHETGLLLARLADAYSDIFYSRPARYIAVSEATRRSLVERCGIPNAKIAIIHEFI